MSTLIVNGNGIKFKVTRTNVSEDCAPKFVMLTQDGIKKVKVSDDVDVKFNEVA